MKSLFHLSQTLDCRVSCMLHDGTFHANCMCEFQEDESIPYKSDIMKPCAMVE